MNSDLVKALLNYLIGAVEMDVKLDQIIKNQEKQMAQNDDLLAVVKRLSADHAKEADAIAAALSNSAAKSDPVVADAIKSLSALADTIEGETAKLTPATATGTAGTASPTTTGAQPTP